MFFYLNESFINGKKCVQRSYDLNEEAVTLFNRCMDMRCSNEKFSSLKLSGNCV